MRFISCASYYGSGSSAITDFVSEFDTVYSFTDEEFRFVQDPDGVSDLEYNLVENFNRHNSGHAIKRYKKLVDFYCGNMFGKKYEKFFHVNWKKYSEKYKGEVFAPENYSFEYLFATTLAGQPLAWMEGTNLPEEAFTLREHTEAYKKFQHDMHSGTILPIGDEPSGRSWTGFQSLKKDRGYLIVYRENHPEGTTEVETWLPEGVTVRCIPLMGHGKAMTAVTGKKGRLEISLPSINDYVVYKYEIKNKR